MSKFAKFRDSTAGCIIILAAICLVVTAALSGTYATTKDLIAASEMQGITDALKVVLPEADNFEEVSGDFPEAIQSAYAADNGAGYAFVVAAKGYGGAFNIVVGMDASGAFTGMEVQANEETQGIGSKVLESAHLDQYKGVTEADAVAGISGASVTSGAVKDAAAACVTAYGALA